MASGTVKKPIPVLDTGTFGISSSTTGNKSGSVSFNTPFSKKPVVIAVWNEKNNGIYFYGGIAVENITTTGFSWSAAVKQTYDAIWNVCWVAFLV